MYHLTPDLESELAADDDCDGLTPNIGDLEEALYHAGEQVADLRARGALPDGLDAMYQEARAALFEAFERGLGAALAAERRVGELLDALQQLEDTDRWLRMHQTFGVPDEHPFMREAAAARERAQAKATRACGRMTTPGRPSRSCAPAPQPRRRVPLQRPGHARRPRARAMRSSAASGDSPDDDPESEPPERAGSPLRLWRHPRWGNVSPNLLRALTAAERAR